MSGDPALPSTFHGPTRNFIGGPTPMLRWNRTTGRLEQQWIIQESLGGVTIAVTHEWREVPIE